MRRNGKKEITISKKKSGLAHVSITVRSIMLQVWIISLIYQESVHGCSLPDTPLVIKFRLLLPQSRTNERYGSSWNGNYLSTL